MATVFVVGPDWHLRALVRAELRERGIAAFGYPTLAQAGQAIAEGLVPQLVVLDAAEASDPAAEQLAQRLPILLIASPLTPTTLAGAARVLPRPVRIADIVAAVEQLLAQRW